MKRFTKVFANNSRDVIVVVKQDTDSRSFRVLQWEADETQPKEIKQFRYVPRELATSTDAQMQHQQDEALRFAARHFYEQRQASRARRA